MATRRSSKPAGDAGNVPPKRKLTVKKRRLAARPEPIDDETLAALSAAVAAYLGHTARIRHVRLIHRAGPNLWTQTARQGVQTAWAALRSAPHREVGR